MCVSAIRSLAFQVLQPGKENGMRFKTYKMTVVILELQAKNDRMNTYVVLIVCFVHRRRRPKQALEASPSLLPTKSLRCVVHLSLWIEIQENSRNCELELRQPGLKFTSLKLPCVL